MKSMQQLANNLTKSERPKEIVIDEYFFIQNSLDDIVGPDMLDKMTKVMKRVTGAKAVGYHVVDNPNTGLVNWVFKFKYEGEE